jgi:peroxiredoxin
MRLFVFFERVQARHRASVLTLHFLVCFLTGAFGGYAVEPGLKWQTNDATKTLGGYIQQRLTLSTNKPSSAKKLPPGLSAVSYGELKIGPQENPATRVVLLDEPKGAPPRFFLDSNGDGDLTNDETVAWTQKSVPTSSGVPVSVYVGQGTVKIQFGTSGSRDGRLGFFRRDRSGAGDLTNELFYYRDYFLRGELTLGGKSYQAALVDEFASGDFRGKKDPEFSGVRLLMDFNGDSRFDLRRESLDVQKPFNVGGTNWEFANMTADGQFEFKRSTQTAPEIVIPPNLARGSKFPEFTAKTTTGKEVKFPADYRGKIVLLDFWATWCGPCLAELPNVVQNYDKYHARGLEILGISLDRAESIDKLPTFTKEKNMSWPQICDGKGWQAELAVRYGVESIPFMLLIDGNNGEILADTAAVRAQNLGPAIESALARLKPPAK